MLLRYLVFLLSVLGMLSSCNRDAKENSINPSSILTVNLGNDPSSLDPRLARDTASFNVLKMLFEGLTRLDKQGVPIPALAEEIHISEDLKTYTFRLRQSYWSDGTPLTANDFEYTWKSLLQPDFPSEYAHAFYVIKNAESVKEGKLSVENVGIESINDQTLQIHLEEPTPYFLHLTSLPVFFPINQKQDLLDSSWQKKTDTKVISNGPFILDRWESRNEMILSKNSHYYGTADVKIHAIRLVMLDEATELNMFESGELSWAGSPLSTLPADSIAFLKEKGKVCVAPALGTHFFRLNVEKPPFNHVKMRKAFSYAIDRESIVDHILQAGQVPAMGFLPNSIALQKLPYFKDHDLTLAKQNFQEALDEMGIDKEQLPIITLSYTMNDRHHKLAQAIQQQWKKAFDIDVHLENMEGKAFLQKRKTEDYQIANGSWIGDYSDPINFLEIFKKRENSTNNTAWENLRYRELLDLAQKEGNSEKRKAYLHKAEKILMSEMPIIPIFYYTYAYLKQEDLQGAHLSDLGHLDFKDAFFAPR